MKHIRYVLPLTLVGLVALVLLSRQFSKTVQSSGERQTDAEKRLERLRSVPYTMVTDDGVPGDPAGVLVYRRDEAYPGFNVYCAAVAPEVLLMDMEGNIIHKWTYVSGPDDVSDHAIVLTNGDALVIDKFNYLLRLDWLSNVIWRRKVVAHHDVALAPDSTFYLISLEGVKHRGLIVRSPMIVQLGWNGEDIAEWSAYDHLGEIKQVFDRRSFLDTILDSMLVHSDWLEVYKSIAERREAIIVKGRGVQYDLFHLNTITILPDTPLGKEDRRFRAGNLLICFRNVNQIGILDRDTKEPLWAWGEGTLEWPHHPTMLDNGNILIFDNGSFRKYSRVLEIDPVTETIVWDYVGDPPESFFSYGRGSAQRLPNGNTLVCEGDRARVFEITSDGEVVWEWVNPRTKDGRRVKIYRMMRLPQHIIESLLN
jgi:hypothetical protein